MNRRQVLAAVGAAATSLAGCIEGPGDAVVRAVPKSPSDDPEIVVYDELPRAEQRIVQTAVEEDVYHTCPELPDAVRSLAARFERPLHAYLSYRRTQYALWIRIEDTVHAGTASSPDDEPSCGLF